MSKKGVLTAIAVCLLLIAVGAGILGWMWISRDRAAVASYRVRVPVEAKMSEVVAKEEELMKSTEVLQPVVIQLGLQEKWKMQSEEEALARLRAKLSIKAGRMADRVKVVYRDRNQDRALEILAAINRNFAKARYEASDFGELPPIVPPDRDY